MAFTTDILLMIQSHDADTNVGARTRVLGKSLKTQAADHVYPSVEWPQHRALDSPSSPTDISCAHVSLKAVSSPSSREE